MMGAVFAMQGFGQFTAGLIALIVTVGFKESLETAATPAKCSGVCQVAVDKMWRVIIGFGAVPGCIALYYRLTIPETPRYTFDVSRDVVKGGSDIKAYIAGKAEGHPDDLIRVKALEEAGQLTVPQASYRDFFHHYGKWKYAKVLIGTAGSWFLLDVAFYGLGLNTPVILKQIGFAGGKTVYEQFYHTAAGNLILVCAGAIPGYWVTVATVDTIGRKPIQLGGFTILTILFCIIGFGFDKIGTKGIFALYVICEFFLNFGKLYNYTNGGDQLLTLGRPQRDHLHRPRRVLPHPLPVDQPRYLGCVRQGRRHHRPGRHRYPRHPRRAQGIQRDPVAQARHADLCSVHVRRHLHHSAHPRDQAQDTRAAGRRSPRHARVRRGAVGRPPPPGRRGQGLRDRRGQGRGRSCIIDHSIYQTVGPEAHL